MKKNSFSNVLYVFAILLLAGMGVLSGCAAKDNTVGTLANCTIGVDCPDDGGNGGPTPTANTFTWNNGRGDLAGTSVSPLSVKGTLSDATTLYDDVEFGNRQTAVVDSQGDLYVCTDDGELMSVNSGSIALKNSGQSCKGDLTLIDDQVVFVSVDGNLRSYDGTSATALTMTGENGASLTISGLWPKLMSNKDGSVLYYSDGSKIVKLTNNDDDSFTADASVNFDNLSSVTNENTIVDSFVVDEATNTVVVVIRRNDGTSGNAGVQSLVAAVFDTGVFDKGGISVIAHQTSQTRVDYGVTTKMQRPDYNTNLRIYQQISEPVIIDGAVYVSKYYLLSNTDNTSSAGRVVRVDTFSENPYPKSEQSDTSKLGVEGTQLYEISLSSIVAADTTGVIIPSGSDFDNYRYSPVSGLAGNSVSNLVLGIRTAQQEYPFISTYVQNLIDTRTIKEFEGLVSTDLCYNFHKLYMDDSYGVDSSFGSLVSLSGADDLVIQPTLMTDKNGYSIIPALGSVAYPLLDASGNSVFVFSTASFSQTGNPHNILTDDLSSIDASCADHFDTQIMDSKYSIYSNIMLKYGDNKIIELQASDLLDSQRYFTHKSSYSDWLIARPYVVGGGQVVVISKAGLLIVK